MMVLDLGNNKIQELPRALPYYLQSLNNLNVLNNDIPLLPHMMGLHKNLKNLQVDGNPLKMIRRAIIDKGSLGVMTYLRDKFNSDVDSQIEPWAMELNDTQQNQGAQQYAEEYKQEPQY